MKVRQLKRRVRKVVFYSWNHPPRPLVPNMPADGSNGGFMFRWVRKAPEDKPPVMMVGGHGFGWKPVWVRPR